MIDRHELFVHFSVHSSFEKVRTPSRPFSKIMSTLIKYSEAFYESGEGFAHKTLIKRLFVNLTNCKRHMNAVLNLNLLTLPAGSYSKPSLEGDG